MSVSAAAAAPWCAAYRNGSNNCGFYTYEQCMAAVSGVGGFCNRNYDEPERPAVRGERAAEPKSRSGQKAQERAAPSQKSAPPPAAAAQPPAAPASTVQQQASFGAARALILSGKYEAGIAAMKALGRDDHPDVAGSIGFASARLGRPEEARAWYARALAADPGHVATLGNSGALYVAQGDLAKARADLDRVKTACGGTACREYRELESLIAAKAR